MKPPYDLIIRNGSIADGTGGPLREADVAVQNGYIAEVGRVTSQGREEIDATGLLVTPGIVGLHTHYDGQETWDQRLIPPSWHGVTTAVMGNCGVGFAPVKAGDRERLLELMEGVEDIPGEVLKEGLKWRWHSFGEYLDVLDTLPRDIDLCTQLAHGPLRMFVMGERAMALEPATAEDIARMRQLTAQALMQGALGFSTTRTINHRSASGENTPSFRAHEDELSGIAMGLRDAGRGVFQFISDWGSRGLEAEFAMMRRLVERSGRPLSFSLGQMHARPDEWRRLLDLTQEAVNAGLDIRAQIAPRSIAVLQGLQGAGAAVEPELFLRLSVVRRARSAATAGKARRDAGPRLSRTPAARAADSARVADRATTVVSGLHLPAYQSAGLRAFTRNVAASHRDPLRSDRG